MPLGQFHHTISSVVGLRPSACEVLLPALSLDEAAYCHNRDFFLEYARGAGVRIAPHAKTPMSADIAADLIEAGAWAATVANLQQAEAMLSHGISRILIANGLGGLRNAPRLAALQKVHSECEIVCIADSVAAVEVLSAAATEAESSIPVLVEVGAGRSGARTFESADTVAQAILRDPMLILRGVATYEGSVEGLTEMARIESIDALLALVSRLFLHLRRIAPADSLIISAGGSLYFDRVIEALGPVVKKDTNSFLLLRSGAIFFYDHGIYRRGLAAMDRRGGLLVGKYRVSAEHSFRPALKLWAEVLSLPEPGLAICGFGMRDVSFDQGMPVPLAIFRDGLLKTEYDPSSLSVIKLNDQHAFLRLEKSPNLSIGDVVAFGISHPCTCFDRWRQFYVLSDDQRISGVCQTLFS
jgi:D-serine dehydratase